jgi:hypothetical protein
VSDHEWILKTVFTTVRGKIEPRRPLQLWYNPPPPQLLYNQPPRTPDRFFANKLFYWAPYHMFAVKLICPEPKCNNHQLTSSSTAYKHTVRQVLDLDGYYSMASEYLECTSCRRRFISWSDVILKQLNVGHRSLFPAILTYRLVTVFYGLVNNAASCFK